MEHRRVSRPSPSPRPLTLALTVCLLLLYTPSPASPTPTTPTPRECPAPCTCPSPNNTITVDCSRKFLSTPPPTHPDTQALTLSHNSLGPIINDSFPRMARLTDLDLSYNGLTRLLGCTLQGMLGLKRLSLRGNRLTSLPDSLFTDANGLERLDVSHNLLLAVPDHVFRNLMSLKFLDASHNKMAVLRFGLGLQVPRHLQHIDLSHNRFDVITADSFQMASGWEPGFKRTLNLAHCRLTAIESPALEKIPGLHDLDLSGNPAIPSENLTSVVKELETTGLEKLSISGVNLTSLEPLLGDVTQLSLKHLNASYNHIRQVPANTFSTLSSIRVLDLSGNQLTSLPAGFSDLRNLKVLNVSSNAMTSFQGDDVISNLDNLEILDVSNNDLSDHANVNFGPLTKLTRLDISRNQLTAVVLPGSTDHLQYFDAHSNAVTQFAGFDNVPKLEHFDISDNALTSVDGYLFKQSLYLKLANFSKNDVTKLDTNAFLPHSPLVVDLSDNLLTKIQFSNWLATQELHLHDNEIQHLDFQTFRRMNGLRVLDLSNNKLSHLHEDLLDHTSGLTHLNLSHNAIQQTYFYMLFRHLENLKVLDLGNNNISHLNESMLAPIPNLEIFSLSQNNLAIVKPRVFRDLKHVTSIDLSGNPFICNCENLAFKDWISRTTIGIPGLYATTGGNKNSSSSSTYVCKGPADRLGKHVTDWSPGQFECDNTMLYMIVCGSVVLTLLVAGVVSTAIYRIYKCHKRRKLEREKEKFRQDCYGDDYDDDDDDDDDDDEDDLDGLKKNNKKGGKLDLSKMTSDEIAEEITHAIERRERRSMRKAEEKKRKNSNGYVPWPPTAKNGNGNGKASDDEKKKKNGEDNNKNKSSDAKKGSNSQPVKGRRESIEARQYDRIIQQQNQDAKLRYVADTTGGLLHSRGDGEEEEEVEEVAGGRRSYRGHRGSAPAPATQDDIAHIIAQQQHHSLKQPRHSSHHHKARPGSGYVYYDDNTSEPREPEPDYGYETEPSPKGGRVARAPGGRDRDRDGRRPYNHTNRWDDIPDIWDHRGQGHTSGRSRSQGRSGNRDRYMTLPIREHDYPGQGRSRSARREPTPRMYLDPYTNEVRFGAAADRERGRERTPRHHPQPQRAKSLHYIPQEYHRGDHQADAYRDHRLRVHQQPQQQQQQRSRHGNDDRRPLIGGPTRAASQPYLVSENTSDWL